MRTRWRKLDVHRSVLAAIAVLVGAGLAGQGAAGAQAPPAPERCVVCHGEQGQELQRSAHAVADLSCTTCHGGDPAAVDQQAAHGPSLRTELAGVAGVELCSSCHSDVEKMRRYGVKTDQLVLYRSSGHGKRLFENGDPNVATCTSCHGVHDILRVADPLARVHELNLLDTCGSCHADATMMAPYGHSAEIPQQYRSSAHGVALLEQRNLASPSCADCHGSHGALPPRVEEVSSVCGHCHTVVLEEFLKSPHARAAAQGAMEQCTSCHGNHGVRPPSVEMFQGEAEGHCGSCHGGEKDPALQTARALHEGITSLQREMEQIEAELREAAAAGIFIEDEQGYLDEARAVLVRARSVAHSVSSEALGDLLNRGRAMIDETRESFEVKSRALRDRRIFTSVFTFVVLVFVGILLIRRREV